MHAPQSLQLSTLMLGRLGLESCGVAAVEGLILLLLLYACLHVHLEALHRGPGEARRGWSLGAPACEGTSLGIVAFHCECHMHVYYPARNAIASADLQAEVGLEV